MEAAARKTAVEVVLKVCVVAVCRFFLGGFVVAAGLVCCVCVWVLVWVGSAAL